MIVVSDTSPLIMLTRISALGLFPALFDFVVIPGEVAEELQDLGKNRPGSDLVATQSWLKVQTAPNRLEMEGLGLGESAAITLAKELGVDLLIDDQYGRKVAVDEGLKVIGTIGMLETAADRELIDLESAFNDLKASGFWMSERFAQLRLDAFRSRKAGGKK